MFTEPSYIKAALTQGAQVFGLTKMDTGIFGAISNVEAWRHSELESLDIHFTSRLNDQDSMKLNTKDENYSCFFKGILFTSVFTKGELLKDFLAQTGLSFDRIICVDDRLEHLVDLDLACTEQGIEFLGIHFDAAKSLPGIPNEQIMNFQQDYLLKNAQWLEDEEAALCLKEARNPF